MNKSLSLRAAVQPVVDRQVHNDPGQQAAAQREKLEMEYCQVEPGPFSGSLVEYTLDGMQINHEYHGRSLYKRGIVHRDLCTISFFTENDARGWCQGERFHQSNSPLFFMPGNVELDIFVESGTALSYIVLDRKVLLERVRSLNPEQGASLPGVFSTLHESSLAVQQALFALETLQEQPQEVDWSGVVQTVMGMLTLATAEAPPPLQAWSGGFGRKCRIVQRARSYMEDCLTLEEVPTLEAVCREAGVSHRMLQYCFQELLNTSPITFLRILRLNKVRAALRVAAPNSTVTAIATHFGFLHMGKFARDYRLHFGETPSTTLLMARA